MDNSKLILEFKNQLDVQSYQMLISLSIELSIHHEQQNILQFISLLQYLIRVFNWSIQKTITNQEFQLLYLEWLKHINVHDQLKDIQQCSPLSVTTLISKLLNHFNHQSLFDTNWKVSIANIMDLIHSLINQNNSNCYKLEELYLLYDTNSIGYLYEYQLLYLYISLTSSQLVVNSFIEFLSEVDLINGKLSLRQFKKLFITKKWISKEILLTLIKKTMDLNYLFGTKGSPNLIESALNQSMGFNFNSTSNKSIQKTFNQSIRQFIYEYGLNDNSAHELLLIYNKEFKQTEIHKHLHIEDADILKMIQSFQSIYTQHINQFFQKDKQQLKESQEQTREKNEVQIDQQNVEKYIKLKQQLPQIEEIEEESARAKSTQEPHIKYKSINKPNDFVYENIKKAKNKLFIKTITFDKAVPKQEQQLQEQQREIEKIQQSIEYAKNVPVLNVDLKGMTSKKYRNKVKEKN